MLLVLIWSFSRVQHLSSSESDDESDKDTEAVDQAKTRESDKDNEAVDQAKTQESDKNQMDQEMDTDEAQMKIQSRNVGHVDTGSINPYDTDEALPSGSDDAGAWADFGVNPEEPGKQRTFLC